MFTITAQGDPPRADVGFIARTTNASPKPNEKTVVSIYPTAAVAGRGLNEITFDLRYHDDLLRFESISGATRGQASVDSRLATIPVTISNTDLMLDPSIPIATMQFTSMLTDTTSTEITLSNVKLNGGDHDFARCAIAFAESDGTEITVGLRCGDPLMRRVLRGEKALEIKSINPNPTQGSITIDYESKLSGAVTLAVYSVGGVLVHEQIIPDGARKPLQLDTSGWPSGAYTIVMTSGDTESPASMVKQ